MNKEDLYIDGKWTPRQGPQTDVFSPVTRARVGSVPEATAGEVEAAVQRRLFRPGQRLRRKNVPPC